MSGGAAILLLAAGASRRMRGQDKLMRPVEGEPLVRRMARRAIATGAPVFVMVPDRDHPRAGALEGLDLSIVPVPDAAAGLSASLKAGLAAAPAEASGLVVMLADMPEVTTGDLKALLAAHAEEPERVVRAGDDDLRPGNPVVLPARLLPALARLSGDSGARALLAEEEPVVVPLPGRHAFTDLDTPEDWARWQK